MGNKQHTQRASHQSISSYPSTRALLTCLESARSAPHYSSIPPIPTEADAGRIFQQLPYTPSQELSKCPEDFMPHYSDNESWVTYQSSGFSQHTKRVYLSRPDISRHADQLQMLLKNLSAFDTEAPTLIVAPLNTDRVASFFAEYLIPEICREYDLLNMFDDDNIFVALSKKRYEQIFIPLPVLINIMNNCESNEIKADEWGISRFYLGGVPVPSPIRHRASQIFNAKVTCLYGMSEAGSIVACDSCYDSGLHFMPSEYIGWEIEKSKPSDNFGELILTCFQRDGTQIVRYQTADVVEDVTNSCGCVIKAPMLKWIGRKDNLVPMGQMNLWWNGIMDEAIFSLPGVRDYRVALTREHNGLDHLVFKISSHQPIQLEELVEKVLKQDDELYTQVQSGFVKTSVEPLTPQDLSSVSFKFRRFVDIREV